MKINKGKKEIRTTIKEIFFLWLLLPLFVKRSIIIAPQKVRIVMPNNINESNFAENPIPVLKLKKKAETRKGEKEKISIKENVSESKLQA